MGNRGQKEPVCPDEPQKSLPNLGKSLKAPPLHLDPENPAEKAPQQTQDPLLKYFIFKLTNLS
jgi:hypothetical protein